MKVIVDLCVVPVGVGTSVSKYVAACGDVLAEAGLKARMHAYGTNIEGEWDEVMAAVKRCHEVLVDMGVPRVHSTMRMGIRTDKDQTLEQKVASAAQKMRHSQPERAPSPN